jgi:glutamine kinase
MVSEAKHAALDKTDHSGGRVFWITGLSGAGKSTIGRKLWKRLQDAGRPAVLLDGDDLRSLISSDLAYSAKDRRRSAIRNSRLCRILAEDGADVVCTTISLFHEVQRWNRENIAAYNEIYVRVPLQELRRRNGKSIYDAVANGGPAHVVGLDVRAEEPQAPDIVINNYGTMTPDAAVDLIWNQFIRPSTLPHKFASKAETLEYLRKVLKSARVLPQIRFSSQEWEADRARILAAIANEEWGSAALIVRSSALGEDGFSGSKAGKYQSVLDVSGPAAIAIAVQRVIDSFEDRAAAYDLIFIQPMLVDVLIAGVAFTRDPNSGAPYLVVNYDDQSARTDSVTSGTGEGLKTFFSYKFRSSVLPEALAPVVKLLSELEQVLNCDSLDVEFAVDSKGDLYLLQVRPLVVRSENSKDHCELRSALDEIACKISLLNRRHPYLHGDHTILGVMPDWNPAEIIGIKPRPLALSLYRELVTDAIWAYQRDHYGYKNLRSFPLLVDLHGSPYIDVRVSFNSFIPRDVTDDLAERLVSYYLCRLLRDPTLHDKIEFEIILSCYTLDLPDRLRELTEYGFTDDDKLKISEALRRLTNRIIHGEHGLWRQERAKIDDLSHRLPLIKNARIDTISKIYWLTEDCKRYGTLPFAGLARAGFIAVQLLRSLVSLGILSWPEYNSFMSGLDTVGSRIGRDYLRLSREEFLARYGHLRPGTYDILSPSYEDAPDLYFDWTTRLPHDQGARFTLSLQQLRMIEQLLKQHGIENDVLQLFEFIQAGIEGREYAKFVFTRHLSAALSLIKQLGRDHGLTVDDCSYLDFGAVRALYNQSGSVAESLIKSVAEGRQRHARTCSILLPALITSADQVYSFHLLSTDPNFITQKSIIAPVSSIRDSPEQLSGTIVFIPSADPGFDWIFTRGIRGFITEFGGVNSHMAIRAGELGIPAVIGAGEILFRRWSAARILSLDCANRDVRPAA